MHVILASRSSFLTQTCVPTVAVAHAGSLLITPAMTGVGQTYELTPTIARSCSGPSLTWFRAGGMHISRQERHITAYVPDRTDAVVDGRFTSTAVE